MRPMLSERFQELAEELAHRDRELSHELGRLREPLRELREQACSHVARFAAVVRSAGSPHLAELEVDALGPDEKHVDCLQFAVRRGRWELVCVGKPLQGRAASGEASAAFEASAAGGEASAAGKPLEGRAASREASAAGEPRGAVTLVGPYRRGKPERPCEEHPLPSPAADRALAERLLELLRQACAR
jgi:hypothetical protein